MTLLVLAIAVGFVARRLSATTSPLPVLGLAGVPLAAVAVQVVNQVSGLGSSALTVASHLLVTLWAILIVRRQPAGPGLGMTVVAVGFAMNLLPVALNGRMPVTESAARAVGFDIDDTIESDNLAKHRIATDDDHLLLLADTIPIPSLRAVVSPGDVVMALGAVLAISPVGFGKKRRSRAGGGTATRGVSP